MRKLMFFLLNTRGRVRLNQGSTFHDKRQDIFDNTFGVLTNILVTFKNNSYSLPCAPISSMMASMWKVRLAQKSSNGRKNECFYKRM